MQQYVRQGKPVTAVFAGDWDPSGRSVPRSVNERMERYGNGELDLDFQQIAVSAADVRTGQFTSHDVNTRDVNYPRFREECQSEGLDPHIAVEVEALSPGLLRSRLDDALANLVDDVRQWNIQTRIEESERELLCTLQGHMGEIMQRTPDEREEDGDGE
ncbi:hypothetical protein [Saccharopolyspora hattusasensis]|uniref:hypothetical protein n=1 Tax=Saccharopolyspora hattusasensis TaxID=1128679 RepID=UPI003D97C152